MIHEELYGAMLSVADAELPLPVGLKVQTCAESHAALLAH